jgi:RNA polymerase sigma factor (sigma-70 family)
MASVAHGLVPPICAPVERGSVSGTTQAAGPVVDEPGLAQRAAGGDGDAFAELYGRYEQRVYNLCCRILGSQDDAADAAQEAFVNVLRRLPKLQGRDLAFGSYVFTSARNACYDLIDRQKRAEPSDQIPESSIPVGGGVGGGGVGFDPGDPEDDPERRLLLAAGQEEIRSANATLPERQREVLALRELEELSYDEIAEIMEMNRNSVAQLISRARISLRDALRGTALASIATSSADCQRAVTLLAARQDRQKIADGEWLADHLLECETCRLSREAMEEAGVSYRAWLPIAAGPLLFRETMAQAAEAVGADWSEVLARREGAAAGAKAARRSVFRHRRIDFALIGLFALLLVVVVFAGAAGDDPPADDPVPVADEVPAAAAHKPGEPQQQQKAKEPKEKTKNSGGQRSSGAAAQEEKAATKGEEPTTQDQEPASGDDSPSTHSNAPTTEDAPPRPADRGTGRRRGGSGRGDKGITGGSETPASDPEPPPPPPTSDPPPQPPPPEQPPPEQPPPEQPPPSQPPGCTDAVGIPIPCGPSRPRQPPPRFAPPPSPRQP